MRNDSRIISAEVLSRLLEILKPNGKFIFYYSYEDTASIVSNLKIYGFTKTSIKENIENSNEFYCEKPSFEVGSSVKLSLAAENKKATTVWKLDDDDDDEVINDDDLLDEEDLKKPDPSSLRVCGTTGKRKACKDCSCGLAEELKAEAGGLANKIDNPIQKSSCGSCYLGDAFRCATCPYLGMPAFKPGEKIKLSDDQLKADI
ncbi:anamorsin homolog [Ctenocephalides felis]|uniref:anamorsin homolog n=1 Tax=Ctenocephalides felis TaxID=7515 RepID=UPI000E6E448C|nr:anamorsin homolog [Ctenocephalides felis]